MTRDELEHAIRAACRVAQDEDLWVFGSQAILGEFPNAPPSLRPRSSTRPTASTSRASRSTALRCPRAGKHERSRYADEAPNPRPGGAWRPPISLRASWWRSVRRTAASSGHCSSRASSTRRRASNAFVTCPRARKRASASRNGFARRRRVEETTTVAAGGRRRSAGATCPHME